MQDVVPLFTCGIEALPDALHPKSAFLEPPGDIRRSRGADCRLKKLRDWFPVCLEQLPGRPGMPEVAAVVGAHEKLDARPGTALQQYGGKTALRSLAGRKQPGGARAYDGQVSIH